MKIVFDSCFRNQLCFITICQQAEGLAKRISVLHQVAEACPGLVDAQLGLGQAYTEAGDYNAAKQTAKQILAQLDSANTDAHLILAQIHLAQVITEPCRL